mgnify:CR=1 FL=1
MDSVTPTELVRDGTAAGLKKAPLPLRDMLLRRARSGAILGIATSLAFVIVSRRATDPEPSTVGLSN